MLTVKWRVWLENKDGEAVFGKGRARLLQAIDETGSLKEASQRLHMAYRTAWGHLNAMEKGLGKRLVERHAGGTQGGHSKLTEDGRELLNGYIKALDGLAEIRDRRFQKHLPSE